VDATVAGHGTDGRHRVIVIGASAGGVGALGECLAGCGDLQAPMLIAMHLPAGGQTSLPAILQRMTPLEVRLARHHERLVTGTVLVCPPDHHLLVGRRRVRLSTGPRENRARPAVDPLFRSAAQSHGAATIAVVLSGMLGDGAAGMLAVRRAGGYGIVQDPQDALFGGMPSTALEIAGADVVLKAADIGEELERLAQEEVRVEEHPDEPDIVELDTKELQRRTQEGELTGLTCPECNAALWEHVDGNIVTYRCRVGHAFSLEHLDEAQTGAVEDAMWMAVRALEEQASLINRSVRRMGMVGTNDRTRRRMQDRASDALDRAEVLRDVLAKRAEAEAEAVAASPEPAAPELPSG
jgi:two-component system chemotaxis response regulator CheB